MMYSHHEVKNKHLLWKICHLSLSEETPIAHTTKLLI